MWFVILIKRETFSSEVAFRDGRTVKLIRPLTTGQKILEIFKILGQENSHSMIFIKMGSFRANFWGIQRLKFYCIDVGDECWRRRILGWQSMECRQNCLFGHQHSPSLNISVGYQHSKDVTEISVLSPTYTKSRQF